MQLWIEPVVSSSGPQAMAIDCALLDHAEAINGPSFRHYTWDNPIWSFGYSQRIKNVRTLIGNKEHRHIVRRPTGGGIVSHKNDWTYALIIPAQHPLAQSTAKVSYALIHQVIRKALQTIGVPSRLAPCTSNKPANSGICFKEPVPNDVLTDMNTKIAGAAQKRTRSGLLIQGSIYRDTLHGGEPQFHAALVSLLEKKLGCSAQAHDHLSILKGSIDRWEAIIGSKSWLNMR